MEYIPRIQNSQITHNHIPQTKKKGGGRTMVAKKLFTNIHRTWIYALYLMIKLFISTLRYINLMFRVEILSYATQYANVVI